MARGCTMHVGLSNEEFTADHHKWVFQPEETTSQATYTEERDAFTETLPLDSPSKQTFGWLSESPSCQSR